MPRRVSLPGADELFRSTGGPLPLDRPDAASTVTEGDVTAAGPAGADAGATAGTRTATRLSGPRSPSRRERHDEKITVYVSPEELIDLEHARLVLRADHGLGIDRGRIVREALAVVLADLEAKGDQSILVRRLRHA